MNYNIENFKTTFTNTVENTISANKSDTDKQLAENKSDTDKQLADFEGEINRKIEQVNKAAEQLNRLDEVLEECEQYAGTAEENSTNSVQQAELAKSYATTTQEELNTIKTEHEEIISDMSSIKEQTITDIENIKSNIETLVSEKETSLQNQFNSYSTTLDDEIDGVVKNYDRLNEGVNLEEKFALEIGLYDNKYAWLENRKTTGDFTGIHVGDYFYTTMKAGTVAGYSIAAQTFKCRIVGINTYKGCGDTEIGNMFYINTDEVIDTPIKWNPADNNNGTSNRNNPWLASAIKAILNGENNYDTSSGYNKVAHGANASSCGIINLLEDELVAVLKDKRNILDNRYSSSGLLTGGTGWAWADMGKLWLPNEIEVYGCGIRSDRCLTSGFWFPEAGLSIQFPYYANNCGNRVKRNSSGGRCYWWLSSVASSNTTTVCYVNASGYANSYSAANATFYAPLCFCI
jgi:phage shock protein A